MSHGGAGRSDVADVLGVLEAQLAAQRLCAQVAIEVAVLIEEYLPSEGELMAAVAADVVARWTAHPVAGVGRPELFGPGGFVAAYVAAVERDRHGRPHRVFCRPGEVVGGELVTGCGYGERVWAHHAGWLLRLAPPVPDVQRLLAGQPVRCHDQIRRLHQQIGVQRLRVVAAAALTPLVWQALGQDRRKVTVVVAGLVAAWQTRRPNDPQTLTGPGGFVDAYFARVSYLQTGEAAEDFWPEFLPDVTTGERVDVAAYERAVWTHHVNQLVGAQ